MALSITRTYSTLNVLTEAQLNAAFDSIENKFNSVLILGSEIASGTIEVGNLATNSVSTAKIIDGAVTGVKRLMTTSAAKNSAYTATTSDEFIPVTTASAWTLTLYAHSAGRRVVIQKTSSDFNALTINDSAAALVTTVNTQGETVELLTDGTTWYVVRRYIPQTEFAITPASYQGIGTPTGVVFTGSRRGPHLRVRGTLTTGTVDGTELRLGLPTGLTTAASLAAAGEVVGQFISSNTTAFQIPHVFAAPSAAFVGMGTKGSAGNDQRSYAAANSVMQTGNTISVCFEVPITGWKG